MCRCYALKVINCVVAFLCNSLFLKILNYSLFWGFFPIYFYQLEANYFTILQRFLPYIDMNHPWIYTYSPSPSLWVFPVHQPRALVSCMQPGLVIWLCLSFLRGPCIGKALSWDGPEKHGSSDLESLQKHIVFPIFLPNQILTVLGYALLHNKSPHTQKLKTSTV